MPERAETELAIRPARSDGREALEGLQWRSSLHSAGDQEALRARPDAIVLPVAQIAAGHVVVAESHGSLIGFAAIAPRDDGDTELDGLFVDPPHMRHGVGRRLVDACVALARGRGSRFLHVVGNPHAMRFYQGCGFEPLGVAQTRFGEAPTLKKPV